MAKVTIKNQNITPYGGIFHVKNIFSKLGFNKLINSTLGKRGNTDKAFSYGSIISTLFFSYLCGADCLEDINELIKQFKLQPDTHFPSADTVGRGLKKLAEENLLYKHEASNKSYNFNTAEKLNTLLLRMIRKMELIKPGSHIDLDFDHQFISNKKYDAKYSYKQCSGYFPGWATVGGIIVGGENRDGNTNVKFRQEDTLRRIMDRVINELNVKIARFRADCGSYSKEIIQTIESRCDKFYIRASNCANRYVEFGQHKEWEHVEIGNETYEVASFSMDNFIENKSYRLVVQRCPLKDKTGKPQTDMFGLIYSYRCILTNDRNSTPKEIILFYNARGASEKNFDIQNNDFGWAHLPFSFMGENMVFMMITAMLKNFYLYLVHHLRGKIKPLKKSSRLKAFILHFISVPAKWTRTGRQNVLNLYTHKTYYAEVFLE